jgi:hypothetical protein
VTGSLHKIRGLQRSNAVVVGHITAALYAKLNAINPKEANMINKEYVEKMQKYYDKNISHIDVTKVFQNELDKTEKELKGLGFSIEFIQDTKTRTDIIAQNAWLTTTCKIRKGAMTSEAFELSHEPYAKYKALLEALKKIIKEKWN